MTEPDTRTDIILFATYWNEENWIQPSLEQIRAIDPIEVMICEGCFDPTQSRESTDDTRPILENFVADYDRASLVSARRPTTLEGVASILQGPRESWLSRLKSVSGWKAVYKALGLVAYRRNQAATFNAMMRMSDFWEPGRWFMTYDADQFYSDAMIEEFAVTGTGIDADLLTGEELTFFDSFDRYTREYERRTYNNMPHRIFPGTMIRPTRDIVLDRFSFHDLFSDGMLRNDLYVNQVSTRSVGEYYHYKMRAPDRYAASYSVGDREEPVTDEYDFSEFTDTHPSIIQTALDVGEFGDLEGPDGEE